MSKAVLRKASRYPFEKKMKRRRENNFTLFLHRSLFVSILLILTAVKPTHGTSLLQVEIDGMNLMPHHR